MEVVGGAVRQFREVVESFGGIVKDLAGDGILALFGTPYAHEDDPERAVLAGLEMQRVVEQHAATVARAAGTRLRCASAGRNGSRGDRSDQGGSHHETGATGDAVNSSARLLQTEPALLISGLASSPPAVGCRSAAGALLLTPLIEVKTT